MASPSWDARVVGFLELAASRRERLRFESDARRAAAVNADTLRAILAHNRDTVFGREHGFASLHTVADFQRALPLSTYAAFRPYVERIAHGEQGVLTADTVEYLGVTSGTTGQRKLLPVTRPHLAHMRRTGEIGRAVVAEQVPAARRPLRGMMLMNAALHERSPGGLPAGALTAIASNTLSHAAPLLYTSPLDVFRLRSHADALYLHLLFGLRERSLGYIRAPFASGLLDAVHLLERRWPDLVEDIRRGRVHPGLALEPGLRLHLEAHLRPDAARARELARLIPQGRQGLLRRLWPQLAYVTAITGGGFSLYARQLASAREGVPLYPGAYASTEATLGVSLGLERAVYCLLPGSAFVELIPTGELDAPSPRTLLPEQLEEGETYEVVVTTQAGLYRYRMGDVVRVAGRHGEAPLLEFLARRGALLNLMGEKTTEHAARQALEEALATQGLRLADYSAVEDTETLPGHYVFFAEAQEGARAPVAPERLSGALEEALCRANPFYASTRSADRLGPATLHLVEPGTFRALRDVLVRRGGSPTQVKVPRVVRDTELQDVLWTHQLGGPAHP